MTSPETDREVPLVRALRTLDLLQNLPGITAAELAERLGVTDRAARRYVATLRAADIAIESTRGPYGGYRLGRGVRLPPLVFSASEALGLVMAVLDGRHAAVDGDDPVGVALGKLLRALPDTVGRQARAVRAGALAAPDRTTPRADPLIITAAVEAVAEHRQAMINYRTGSGNGLRTAVDPWAVVIRAGRWYLLCRADHADAVRTLRIDRIQDLTVLTERFAPPADLDPVALLEQHLGSGWEHDTRVRFDAPYADVSPWVPASMGRLEPTEDGRGCLLTGSTSNPEMYAGERLAAIPYSFRVEGGPELLGAVTRLAGRLAAAVD